MKSTIVSGTDGSDGRIGDAASFDANDMLMALPDVGSEDSVAALLNLEILAELLVVVEEATLLVERFVSVVEVVRFVSALVATNVKAVAVAWQS
jgi:hypothetical protein